MYEVTHRTSYTYDAEVTRSYGRAHLVPRNGDGQRRIAATVTTEPAPAELRDHTDFFGNRSTYFAVTTAHDRLQIVSRSTIAVQPNAGGPAVVARSDVRSDPALRSTRPPATIPS